jgi:hypothetical protein
MDTNYREDISLEERLASGLSYEQNQYLEGLFISQYKSIFLHCGLNVENGVVQCAFHTP